MTCVFGLKDFFNVDCVGVAVSKFLKYMIDG
jgi:hypothetical protein